MYTRKEYLNDCGDGGAAHRRYYSQFVDLQVRNFIEHCFGTEKLVKAFETDEHFNNIPLHKWDGLYPMLRAMVGDTNLKMVGDFWSLSAAVCIAKEAARQVVERELEKRENA